MHGLRWNSTKHASTHDTNHRTSAHLYSSVPDTSTTDVRTRVSTVLLLLYSNFSKKKMRGTAALTDRESVCKQSTHHVELYCPSPIQLLSPVQLLPRVLPRLQRDLVAKLPISNLLVLDRTLQKHEASFCPDLVQLEVLEKSSRRSRLR